MTWKRNRRAMDIFREKRENFRWLISFGASANHDCRLFSWPRIIFPIKKGNSRVETWILMLTDRICIITNAFVFFFVGRVRVKKRLSLYLSLSLSFLFILWMETRNYEDNVIQDLCIYWSSCSADESLMKEGMTDRVNLKWICAGNEMFLVTRSK